MRSVGSDRHLFFVSFRFVSAQRLWRHCALDLSQIHGHHGRYDIVLVSLCSQPSFLRSLSILVISQSFLRHPFDYFVPVFGTGCTASSTPIVFLAYLLTFTLIRSSAHFCAHSHFERSYCTSSYLRLSIYSVIDVLTTNLSSGDAHIFPSADLASQVRACFFFFLCL